MRRAVLVLVLPFLVAAVGTARPWIGVAIEAGAKGVKIKQVIEATPGERAGLRAGDEITALDGAAVKEPAELIQRVQEKGVGTKVTLTVLRDGKDVTVTLALEAKPDDLALLRSRLIDKPAPAFDLAAAKGPHAAKLADLSGKVVVVEFWATWCGPCTASTPELTKWQDKYGKQGLRVVAISSEEADKITKYALDKKLPYTVASDPEGDISEAYYVPAIPTLVVIDRKGVVRYAGVGAGDNLAAAEAAFLPLLKN